MEAREPIWPDFSLNKERNGVVTFVRVKDSTDGKWYNCKVYVGFHISEPTMLELASIIVKMNLMAYRYKLFGIVCDVEADGVKMFEVDKYQCSDAGRIYLIDRMLFPDLTKPPVSENYPSEWDEELTKLWEENFKDNPNRRIA